jgi:putative endonuclease
MRGPFYVYILASRSRTLYVGVTNDLARRLDQHRTDCRPPFTRRYNISALVHVECFDCVSDALRREKQIKAWRRHKKLELIETQNPVWKDLGSP